MLELLCQGLNRDKPYLIRAVMNWSPAVLFHTEMMSSCCLMDTTAPQISSPTMNCSPRMANIYKRTYVHTQENEHMDSKMSSYTVPDTTYITLASTNENMYIHMYFSYNAQATLTRFSQHRDTIPFFKRTIHFPPFLLASSLNIQTMRPVHWGEYMSWDAQSWSHTAQYWKPCM